MTALITAGVEPIVPASPTPFTPNAVMGLGVTVESILEARQFGRGRHEVIGERPRCGGCRCSS